MEASALSMVKDLFGPTGYRTYADALGRQSTRFHASVSDPTTVTSRLVALACKHLRQAKEQGHCPLELLTQSEANPFTTSDGGLEISLHFVLGDTAHEELGSLLAMSRKAVRHAIECPDARYAPHFRLIAHVLLTLKRSPKLQRAA